MFKKFLKIIKNKILIKKITRENDIKKIFSTIYEKNYWGDKESYSGPGSNNKNTKKLVNKLKFILKKFRIKKIVDAPCGDFYWIKNLILNSNVNYVGVDIVKKLITQNKKKYEKNKTKFFNLNIITNNIPKSDLIICRDFIFHLSNRDIFNFFKNIYRTEFKYLLISNHTKKSKFINKDIKSGDFRKIDLFSHPFNFGNKYNLIINDFCDGKEKYLILYRSAEIKKYINNNINKIKKI